MTVARPRSVERRTAARWHGGVAGLLLIAAVAVAAAANDDPAPEDLRAEVAQIAIGNEALERQVELATGDGFYLLVDPGAREISLRLGGVVLQRLELLEVSVATARVGFVSREAPRWHGVVWTGGRLDPERERERIEIVPPEPGSEAAPVEPAAIEDALLVPSSYLIRFDEGLSLELDSDLPLTAATRFRRVWRRAVQEPLASLGLTGDDRLRLRATVPAVQFAALYRSLPPDVQLLVLPTRPPQAEP